MRNPLGMLLRWLTKRPITIRAALITGFFSMLAVFLAFVLGYLDKATMTGPDRTGPGAEHEKLEQRAVQVICDYYGLKALAQDHVKIEWFDFASRGTAKEFYACYEVDRSRVIDLFTTRDKKPELLFHRIAEGEDLDAAHALINGRTYFLCSAKAGSGGYLTLSLYDYDGIGKPNLKYETEDLFYGGFWVVDNRVFVTTSSRKFELVQRDGQFLLERYRGRLSCPASGTHILSFDIKQGCLVTYFDGTVVDFVKVGEDHFANVKHPVVGRDEQIMIDDNFAGEDRAVRIMVNSEDFSWNNAFFDSLRPLRDGEAGITVSDSYQTWYDFRFRIDSNR